MQTFAVSVLSEKPEGVLQHTLHLLEAEELDRAEARVLARLTSSGHLIRGLLSRSSELDDHESLPLSKTPRM